MSGFSAEWLALREPVDHRSRDEGLVHALAARFAGSDTVTVVDLGCGAGSNLRALAGVLPARQAWTLVDYDPLLLAAARARIAAWAERAEEDADGALRVVKGGKSLVITFRQANLARDLGAALGVKPDLVTAAALFDLASASFIRQVAEAVSARRAVFYTALTYNGEERWEPPHPGDDAVLAAFKAHQKRDKGFGPAAGPEATTALVQAFEAQDYAVATADSPWRLGIEDRALRRDLASGIVGAVRETGRLPEPALADWLENRLSSTACTVGHSDCLALPK